MVLLLLGAALPGRAHAAGPVTADDLEANGDGIGAAAADEDFWTVTVRCPVLYTHEVPSQGALTRMLDALGGAGYHLTRMHDVEEAASGRASVPNGCLVMTMDDALYSQYQNALPVITARNVPVVFFMMPAFSDGVHSYMTAPQIREIHDVGEEVMAHTCNHPSLPRLAVVNFPAFQAEVIDCKQVLEGIIGDSVPYFAYPNGAYDSTVIPMVAGAGFRAAFTTQPSAILTANSPYTLPRIGFDFSEGPATVLDRIRRAGG